MFSRICEAADIEELRAIFKAELTGYWTTHYLFGHTSPESPAVLGEGEGYLSSVLTTKGGEDVISIPTKWDNSPFYEHQLKKNVVNMQGQETYKFAVTSMVRDVRQVMEEAGITGDQVKAVIPHQANYRIINEARRRLPEIAPEKFLINIDRYGNTSSASEPILLDEANRQGLLQRGDYVVLTAFGGGLSTAACIIRW